VQWEAGAWSSAASHSLQQQHQQQQQQQQAPAAYAAAAPFCLRWVHMFVFLFFSYLEVGA
jgi:uncharacterized protein (DUF2236 family)